MTSYQRPSNWLAPPDYSALNNADMLWFTTFPGRKWKCRKCVPGEAIAFAPPLLMDSFVIVERAGVYLPIYDKTTFGAPSAFVPQTLTDEQIERLLHRLAENPFAMLNTTIV